MAAKPNREDTEQAEQAHEQALALVAKHLSVIRFGRIVVHVRDGQPRQVEVAETFEVAAGVSGTAGD